MAAKASTATVTFDISKRGREKTGIDRSRFDWKSACRVINNSHTKEKLKNRDLFGYLGHAYRTVFGLNPQESVVKPSGNVQVYDPAFLITDIYADEKTGKVTFTIEYCDNEMGDRVRRLYEKNHGGFSTVFSTNPKPTYDEADEFFGCDYVYMPNYSTNRKTQAMMDSAAGQANKPLVYFSSTHYSCDTVLYMDSCGAVAGHEQQAFMAAAFAEMSGQLERSDALNQELALQLQVYKDDHQRVVAQLDSATAQKSQIEASLQSQIDELQGQLQNLRRSAANGRRHVMLDSASKPDNSLLSRRQPSKKPDSEPAKIPENKPSLSEIMPSQLRG